jgi:hypothetical protein
MPDTPSADATVPTARLSGSKPMKITLRRKVESPKPREVLTTPLTSCSAKKTIKPSPTPNITRAISISMGSSSCSPIGAILGSTSQEQLRYAEMFHVARV